jgi:phosphatidylinositol glycan class V
MFSLQVIFNALIPDYPDPTAFNPPRFPVSKTVWDRVVVFLFGGYRHWDANYFLHVAEHGYSYEKCLAFFPLFPLITCGIANTLFYPLRLVLTYHNTLLLSAAFINFFLFIKSAKVLFSLGCKVLQDKALAYKAALLYCINPSSVFFSVPYSETTFAFLCFSGMLSLEKSSAIPSAPYLGLAALTRSNGLVTIGFLAYERFKFFVTGIQALVRNRMNDLAPFLGSLSTLCVISVAPLFLSSLLFILPFATFQVWVFKIFCVNPLRKDAKNYTVRPHIIKYGQDMGEDFKFPWNGPFPWCRQKLPISYSYVQNHYWDVGFLNYFTINNIPNFILAIPIVILCCCTAKEYYNRNKKYVLTLGLNAELNDTARRKKDDDATEAVVEAVGYASHKCFVYIAHMVGLLLFGVAVVHIQVCHVCLSKYE